VINIQEKHYLGAVLGRYKRDCYLDIINRWVPAKKSGVMLKTDLYEEAYGVDDLLPRIKQYKHKIGIDHSEIIQEKANFNAKGGFTCVLANLEKLPFKNESFEFILSTSTIDHCSNETMQGYLKEMNRVLNDSGSIVISVNNRHNFLLFLVNKLETVFRINNFRNEFYAASELENIFRECGFNTEESDFVFYTPPFSRHIINLSERVTGGRLNKVLLRLLLSFDSFVRERSGLKRLFSHWVVFKLSKS